MSTSAACGESIIDTFGVKEIFNCGSSLSNIHFDESDNNDNNNNKLLLPKQHQHHLQALLGEGDGGRHGYGYGGGDNSNMSSDNSISDVILFDNDGNFHRTQRRRNSDVGGLVAFRRGGGGAYDSKSNSSLLTDDGDDDNSMTMTAAPKYSKSTSALRKQRRLDRRAEQHFNQPQGATNASWSSKRNNSSADLLAMLPSVGSTRNRNNSSTDLLSMVQKK